MPEFDEEDDNEEDIEDSYEEEDCDGQTVDVLVMKDGKKKKRNKTPDYGRIASAIGEMKTNGINVAPPDINKSSFTFSPDVENSVIRFGLSGIVKVGGDLIKQIIDARPYASFEDFLKRVKINKPQLINLIKAGAFDSFGDRADIMRQYVESVSDTKKRMTLQNLQMLISFGMIPEKYNFQVKVFNFNKYLKKLKLDNTYYGFDNIALNFYSKNFDMDNLISSDDTESGFKIKQLDWDKIYKKQQDIIRPFVRDNADELLRAVNERIISDMWGKYCEGSISKWEMDSVSCYFHDHELEKVRLADYGIDEFFDLPEEPEIDRIITIKGKQVPLFKIRRIAGVVLDKNKMKKTVSLLTKRGVVTVKIYGDVFAHYDRQLSEKGSDGKKHVIEKSMFSRGNKIIIAGVRRDGDFIAKKYSRTPWHLVEQITKIDDNGAIKTHVRGEE